MALVEITLPLGAPLDEVALNVSYALDTVKVNSCMLLISSSYKQAQVFLSHLTPLISAPTQSYISACEISNLDLACIATLLSLDKEMSDTFRYQPENTSLTKIAPWSLSVMAAQLSEQGSKLANFNSEWYSHTTKHLKISLDDYATSNISEIIRESMIAIAAIFRFEELRTAIGSCSAPTKIQTAINPISDTFKAAICYARNLQSAKSLAFDELRLSLEHLNDGSLASDVFNNSTSDLILYRKLLVWQSSLHFSLATSLSSKEGSSNLSLHHCIRCVECYLIGILTASNHLYLNHKGTIYYSHDSKSVQGVSGLLKLSPESVPKTIQDIVTWRNKSELAHGMQRWDSTMAGLALTEVRNYIHSMDSKHSQGEFFIHLRKANSLNLLKSIESIMSITRTRVKNYLTAV